MRSRNHLNDLVSVIRRDYAHIRFQAVEIESLNDRQTVLDALSLTRAMLHRADRVHWLNILRAPWCGLKLADLHALAHDNHFASIWQLIQDENRLRTLSADGQKRLRHVQEILEEAFQHKGRMPLRRWLESTWLKLGGANTLISAGDNRDIQAFFDLVAKTARGFVLDFNQLDTAMKKLYAQPDIAANDKLQFLTVHASKGLEFDTVILPALNRKPANTESPMMLWEEVSVNNHRTLLAAPFTKKTKGQTSTYDFLKGLEIERIDNETARLLYVAATRSIKKLHLVAVVKKSEKDEIKPLAKSLLSILWPSVEAQFLAATTINAQTETVMRLQDFTPQLKRLKMTCLPDLLNQPGTKLAYISPNNSVNTATNTLPNIAADTGTLTHLYMEMIAGSGLSKWPISRIQACAPAMQHWFKQKGYATEHINMHINVVVNALTKSVTSADCAWLLAERNSRQSELSITSVNVFGEPQEQRLDLTFIEQDVKVQKRWIVDYKLTFAEDTVDLVLLAEQHRPQLTRYQALFEHEGLPIQKAVFFLAHGKLVLL